MPKCAKPQPPPGPCTSLCYSCLPRCPCPPFRPQTQGARRLLPCGQRAPLLPSPSLPCSTSSAPHPSGHRPGRPPPPPAPPGPGRGALTLRCSFLMACLSSSLQYASSSSFCFLASAAALASALRARAAADLVFSPWNFLGIPQQAVRQGQGTVSQGHPPSTASHSHLCSRDPLGAPLGLHL